MFETRLGGRLFETVGERTFEVGTVVEWDPPRRLALEWRKVNFAPHEKTLVEVTFTPQGDGTMVRVVHSGWSSIRDDHPVRHGEPTREFLRTMRMWWGRSAHRAARARQLRVSAVIASIRSGSGSISSSR